jgi:hypothetical protein
MGAGELDGKARQRDLGDALRAALKEHAGAERQQRWQRQVPHRRAELADRRRPLEFDGNGFPVAQPTPSFVARMAQLRGPG